MAKRVITKRIGALLLEGGHITQQQLDQGLARVKVKGGQLGQALIQLGFIKEEDVAVALTIQYGFPFLPLEHYELDGELARVVPERLARKYCLIPIDRIGNALTLAMSDPTDVEAVHEIELLTKCVVQTCISTPSQIDQAIERYYPHAQGDQTSEDTVSGAPDKT